MKLTIPYYLHKAGAGFPSPATDYIEEDIDLNIHLIKNVPATFIIRVQGKSMVDVGINDGDLLVVDKSLKPKNFSTVIAFMGCLAQVAWVHYDTTQYTVGELWFSALQRCLAFVLGF